MAERPRRQRCRRNGRLRVRVPLCPPSRLHAQSHGLITRVKPYVSEKTWVFRHSARVSLVPQFCLTQYKGVLCYTKQGMNTAIYTEVPMFSIQSCQGVPGRETGHSKPTVLAGSTPVTSTEMAQWRVISPSPGSRDSLVAVFLNVENYSEQNRLSPPTPLILNGESEGFSPFYGKITEMTSFWDNLPQPFFILAPMEAVTDVVFRHVVKQAGAPDVFFT